MQAQRGFTLLELLVLLAVVAILLTVALPNFYASLESNRELSEMGTLAAALALARNTATQSGSDVLMCASANGLSCTGGDWSQGYAVAYVTPPMHTASVIRRFPAMPGSNTLMNSAGDHVVFHSNGFTDLAGTATFTLCDRRGVSQARALDLLVSGLFQTSTTLGQDVNGQPLVCS